MCGLFGFNGDPAIMNITIAKLAAAKTKILGIYNMERGRHSCGLYINDQIIKGVDGEKAFSDFIVKHLLPNAIESGNFNIIGHTRQATHGDHTVSNAHPFLVDDNFVLAHNGVIRNIWTMCAQYGVDHSDIDVDSHALAQLINENGWKILEQYEGFAALLMAFKNEPNAMYVYRGESKRYTQGKPEEERPLYYLSTEEGTYFSSIERSLYAISDSDKDDIGELPGSMVHKLENGRFLENAINIDRGIMNHGVYTSYVHSPNTSGTGKAASNKPAAQAASSTKTTSGSATANADSSRSPLSSSRKPETELLVPLIWHETLPARVSRWKVSVGMIYQYGRFWLIDNDEISMANGSYYINKKGKVVLDKEEDAHNHYFIEGVMMKNKQAFAMAKVDADIADPKTNFAMFISKYSEYPVCNMRADIHNRCKEVPAYAKYRWYFNQSMCGNFGFTPKFSDRHYTLKDGLLNSISGVKNIETSHTIETQAYKAEVDRLNSFMKEVENTVGSVAPVIHMISESFSEKIAQETKEIMGSFERVASQGALPFKEEKKKNEPISLLHFCMVFTSVDSALETLSTQEIRALRYYIADLMMAHNLTVVGNVFDDEVTLQLKLFLQGCIDKDETLLDNWDAIAYKDIETYMLIASESEDGSYNEVDEEAFEECEACEYIPKPASVEVETRKGWFHYTEATEDEPATKDDEEPSLMESVLSEVEKARKRMQAETAHIPEFDRWGMASEERLGDIDDEKIDDEYVDVPSDEQPTDKEYAFEDAMDALIKAREQADALQANNDDFSQEMAKVLYVGIDPILNGMTALTSKHREFQLNSLITRNIKKRVKQA